jgi:hypothetical protein
MAADLREKRCLAIQEAFEKGLRADKVMLTPDRAGLSLYNLTLVENEGPGPNTWLAPQETVRGDCRVKEIFLVDRPEALAAQLAMNCSPHKDETGPLEIHINGHTLAYQVQPMDAQAADFPPEWLKAGENEVVLSCNGKLGWEITMSRREDIVRNDPQRALAPLRSFKSIDGGKTWTQPSGNMVVVAEYFLRLRLTQYAREGSLIGPIIDLATDGSQETLLAAPVAVKSVKVRANAETPAGTAIEFQVRSSTTPVYEASAWSPWRPCSAAGQVRGSLERFVQWQAILKTGDATVTPLLKDVELEAVVQPKMVRWLKTAHVSDSHNEEILYTSMPFEYEKFDEARLIELRKRYQLDEVVAGARSELEKILLLTNWISKSFIFNPPEKPYPAWDAVEILDRKIGFCVQYAIVLMQCALSFGIQARFVFGHVPRMRLEDGGGCGGHEVTEFWSNEYGKWIEVDPRENHISVHAGTGVPASMWELHQEEMLLYFPDRPMKLLNNSAPSRQTSQNLRRWTCGEPAPRPQAPAIGPGWGCLFWMPRNNFYAHRYPEPLAQGRGYWSWIGFWGLEDAKTPRVLPFSRFSARRSDFEWTINQVRFAAEAGPAAGTVKVRLGTVTPDFETFLASIDGGPWKPAGDTFTWKLKSGANRLEMRIRNRAGVLGKISHLAVKYSKK